MKKVLLFALALCLAPAFAFAASDAPVLAKVKNLQPLSFPQNFFENQETVEKAAKIVFDANPESYAAVFNYAVALSNDIEDEGRYIEPKNIVPAIKYYKKAMVLNPKSAEAPVALADLMMFQMELDYGSYMSTEADALWLRGVSQNRAGVQKALSLFKKGKELGYKGKYPLEDMIKHISSALQQLDKKAITNAVTSKKK